MQKISYDGYRFPPEIIQRAIWLYLRFTLSLRDVEDLLAERGIAVSYETVRRWVNHFGPMVAADLRKRRPKPHTTWHLDEVYLKIAGRMVYLWRAVDAEGEVSAETDAQAFEKIQFRSRSVGHGQLAVVWRRRPRSRDRVSP
jgi:putative transposase